MMLVPIVCELNGPLKGGSFVERVFYGFGLSFVFQNCHSALFAESLEIYTC